MTELLSALGTLSLGGSLVIGILALLAHLSRTRYAARWRCWVWLLLCLRLAIPVSIQFPEQTEIQRPIQLPAPSNTVIYSYQQIDPQPQQPIPPELPDNTQPVTPAPTPDVTPPQNIDEPAPKIEITLFQAISIVWVIGVVGMVAWFIISHIRFLNYVRRWSRPAVDPETIQSYNQVGDLLGLDIRPKLRLCSGLRAPMLAGIFRPTLLLPEKGLTGDALVYSLLHELTHYKRRDIWLKTLALWVNAVHWFNPCMWYMMRLVERDTELACDEAALKKLPREEHGAYGKTILDAVERLKAAS